MRTAFFWVIVGQFCVSFVITALGVIQWVDIKPNILNALVTILIIEQAAAVIGLFKKTDFFGTIESLTDDSWSLLATLWKYQEKCFPNRPNERWFLSIPTQCSDFSDFLSAFAQLKKHHYVEVGANNQVSLSTKGYQFCKSKKSKLAKIDRLFYIG